MSFIDDYKALIITQYFDRPNAAAEIGLQAESWEEIFNFLKSFQTEFDLDLAAGDRLDKIGKLVGVPRIVPFVLDKIRFGFDGDDTARGFFDAFDSSVPSAPFFDAFETKYATQELDDFDYRFFIKAKISTNIASAYMVSDGRVSIQDAVQLAFGGEATVVDNLDMTLFLYVSTFVDADRLRLILQLNLLPKPQGVRYRIVQLDENANSFGFDDDEFALGFGDAFDANMGGVFAEIIFIE
ncbi:MAG: hypothetical protein B6244_14950 [Candidatus Cloacimonetes bacterium 4572_55]|nr:MAG: hypothetical protein B6244_14950 [Candidatus Cloacimonetes bacterium 4572_55]